MQKTYYKRQSSLDYGKCRLPLLLSFAFRDVAIVAIVSDALTIAHKELSLQDVSCFRTHFIHTPVLVLPPRRGLEIWRRYTFLCNFAYNLVFHYSFSLVTLYILHLAYTCKKSIATACSDVHVCLICGAEYRTTVSRSSSGVYPSMTRCELTTCTTFYSHSSNTPRLRPRRPLAPYTMRFERVGTDVHSRTFLSLHSSVPFGELSDAPVDHGTGTCAVVCSSGRHLGALR